MVWFTPEGTLPPPVSSPPSCTWNVKSYKTNQPAEASPSSAVCNTATVCSRGAMQGEQLLGRRFRRRPGSVTRQVTASCDATFLGPAEIAQLRAGEEGRRLYPTPPAYSRLLFAVVNIHLVGNELFCTHLSPDLAALGHLKCRGDRRSQKCWALLLGGTATTESAY